MGDETKVYVSRIPNAWDKEKLSEHFEACFGKVIESSITTDPETNISRGFGFIVFATEDSKQKALEQGSIHVKHKTIQIRPIHRKEDENISPGSPQICFQWKNFSCVKSSNCKFAHEGPGNCAKVSAPGEGFSRKMCLSFKTKGKCSKGDSCKFLHLNRSKDANSTPDQTSHVPQSSPLEASSTFSSPPSVSPTEGQIKVCHTFSRKGKCRKGDSCIFSHLSIRGGAGGKGGGEGNESEKEENEGEEESKKKKRVRIDGKELVKRRINLPPPSSPSSPSPSSPSLSSPSEAIQEEEKAKEQIVEEEKDEKKRMKMEKNVKKMKKIEVEQRGEKRVEEAGVVGGEGEGEEESNKERKMRIKRLELAQKKKNNKQKEREGEMKTEE